MLIQHAADILDAVLPVVEASQPEGNTAKLLLVLLCCASVALCETHTGVGGPTPMLDSAQCSRWI